MIQKEIEILFECLNEGRYQEGKSQAQVFEKQYKSKYGNVHVYNKYEYGNGPSVIVDFEEEHVVFVFSRDGIGMSEEYDTPLNSNDMFIVSKRIYKEFISDKPFIANSIGNIERLRLRRFHT